MKLAVFGRDMEVVRRDGKWLVYLTGQEGKKRLAGDIVIPSDVRQEDIALYLADLCHEWSCPGRDRVRILSGE